MEDPAGAIFWSDGVGIIDGYRANSDRPNQSVPLFICLADSWRHVQPDRYGTDEAIKFFYRVRVPAPVLSQGSVSLALAVSNHLLTLQLMNIPFTVLKEK